jgi:hypothetical protein
MDRAIGRRSNSQFFKFPFNRRGTYLGIRIFQLDPNILDKALHLHRGCTRMVMGCFRSILKPLWIPILVSTEPLEKPIFGFPHLKIDRNWRFPLQVLLDGHFPQRFFVHLITSLVGLLRSIINQFQPQGNRCIGTKTGIKGYRCSGTFELSMYWHLAGNR